jgi:hypothetical protein
MLPAKREAGEILLAEIQVSVEEGTVAWKIVIKMEPTWRKILAGM